MKQTGLIFIFVLVLIRCSCGQQIYMEKTLGGARFETDSLTLSLAQVMELMEENPVAYQEFKKARFNNNAAGICGFSGGLLVSVPLITAAIGGKPEWGMAAAGGALILVSIPLTRSFHRHAENALEDYNAKYQTRIKGNFIFTGTGGKLIFHF